MNHNNVRNNDRLVMPFRTSTEHMSMFTSNREQQLEELPDYDYSYIWSLCKQKGLVCPKTGKVVITCETGRIKNIEVK